MASLPDYAELHCLSNFSFLRGASHPQELVARAHELGYRALALTDECSVAGAVRAHQEAKERGLPLILGTEVLVEVLTIDRRRHELPDRGKRRRPQAALSKKIVDDQMDQLILW